jgi:ketopantoate hydroxymethyltransferase
MLVGDSLGMTVQGHDSTLPVTVEDIAYHTRAVRRGAQPACCFPICRLWPMPRRSRHSKTRQQ